MRTDEPNEDRRLVPHARQFVAQRRHDRAGEAARAHGTQGGQAVRERALADDRGDATVAGGCLDDVAAAERGPPQRDPIVVDPIEAAGVGERGGPVAELALDVEQLPRLPAAVAEVPVGEDQRGDARVGESLGIGLEPVLAGPTEAMAEDHQRRVLGVGHEQPGAAVIVV